MASSTMRPKIIIVGAGLAGSFMAILLGKRDFDVTVYERRGDMRHGKAGGPSMNLGLSQRGIHALTTIGLIDQVMKMVIPMKGRMVHGIDGQCTFQTYGQDDSQVIYAIKRNSLNCVLIDTAEALPNVRFLFNQRFVRLDKECGSVEFRDELTNTERHDQADIIIGADGIFSLVRQQMQRGERADYHQDFLDWGWKELTIPPGPGATFQLEQKVFHLWPRGDCMIFAHPNLDGAFCCSCLLPFEGKTSFATLRDREAVQSFFEHTFSDMVPLSATLADDFLRNPLVPLMSIRTSMWYYKDRVVLLGDACHAVYPFYAQGMNAAFEDCLVLNECIGRHAGEWEAAFAEYQRRRKPNTDALAEMSRQNFIELRDKVRSPLLRARKKLDNILGAVFPRSWMPLHALVTHTTMPYASAMERSQLQDRIVKWCGLALALLVFLPFRGMLLHLFYGTRSSIDSETAMFADGSRSPDMRRRLTRDEQV